MVVAGTTPLFSSPTADLGHSRTTTTSVEKPAHIPYPYGLHPSVLYPTFNPRTLKLWIELSLVTRNLSLSCGLTWSRCAHREKCLCERIACIAQPIRTLGTIFKNYIQPRVTNKVDPQLIVFPVPWHLVPTVTVSWVRPTTAGKSLFMYFCRHQMWYLTGRENLVDINPSLP